MEEKEALQYEQMLKMPVPKLIITMAIPTTLSMLIATVYNLADSYFVGGLGNSAAAAVGVVLALQAIFQAVGFMSGHGSGSNVSLSLGRGDTKRASQFASTGFFFAFITAALISSVGLLFMPALMRLMGSTPTILPYAMDYGVFILLGGPFFSASQVLNVVIRYEGHATLAMVGIGFGGILNMVLDPIFIYGLHMGISGAGLATMISQITSFLILFSMFFFKKTITTISFKNLLPTLHDFSYILRNGMPSLTRQVLNVLAISTLNLSAAPFGDEAIAAMTIVGRIVLLISSLMIGIGQTIQPVGSYTYAAKKYERMRSAFRFTFILSEVLMLVLGTILIFNTETMISLFRQDPVIIRIGTPALISQAIATFLEPTSVVFSMLLQGAGKSKGATVIATFRNGIFYIPTLLILPNFFGLAGIQNAQLVSDVLTLLATLPMLWMFFRRTPNGNFPTRLDERYQAYRQE